MPTKIHQLILLLAFLAICNGSEDKDLQGPNQDPITSFRPFVSQFQAKVAQYPSYSEISQSLSKVDSSFEELMNKFRETFEKKKMLRRNLSLNNSLLFNPTKHEETMGQFIESFGGKLQELKTSFQNLVQEINQIPINTLIDGQGKEFKELNHKIDYFRGEAESCSNEYLELLNTLQKIDHENNISLGKIKTIDEYNQLRTNRIQKNNDRIKVIDQKIQEEAQQLLAKFNEKQGSYQTEEMDKKKAELQAKEESIHKLNENLVELNTKLLELRAAENQDPSTVQGTEQEIQRITESLTSEKQERLNIIKMIEELSTGAPLLQDESLTNKESLTHLQNLDGERIKLFQENSKLQLEISERYSERDKIPIFTVTLEDLKQRLAVKKEECNKIQESIEQKKKERDLLVDDKTLEVGVLTQQDLIKEWGKMIDLKQSCLELLKYELNRFETDKYNLENFLQASSFKSLEKDMRENPDLYLALVYDNDYCQESLDCLKRIFLQKLPETNFNTQVPLLTHLSAIFTRTDNISSLLKDDNNKLPKEIQDLMKTKYLAFKKSKWSFTSILQYVVDIFFDSNPTLFVKVGAEEFDIELTKMETVYRDIINRMKKDYDIYRWNRYEGKLKELIEEISSSNIPTGLNGLTLTHSS